MKQKKPEGWSSRKIKSALEDNGISLRQLSIAHEHPALFCSRAMRSGNAIGQELIARALAQCAEYHGLTAQAIWPDRYDSNGQYQSPKRGRATQSKVVIFPDLVRGRNLQLQRAA
jgi:lambda repressor-like predicted transcriptional regulator